MVQALLEAADGCYEYLDSHLYNVRTKEQGF